MFNYHTFSYWHGLAREARLRAHIDGKLVDFNDMVIVIVKCFDYNWMNGSESD